MTGGARITAERRRELEERLAQVRERIADATKAAGRQDEPTLIAVTKFFPVEDLVALAEAGVRDVGENREQEFLVKADHLRLERPDLDATVKKHFIGQIQSKKTKRIGAVADVVQSVDRLKLVEPLARAAQERSGPLEVLLQVNLDTEAAGRGGVAPGELLSLADAVAAESTLRLRGLMAVAPLGEDPAAAFSRLAAIREDFLAIHPEASMLSAGMTGDLEEAVAIGATHLRVGSAILGSRPTAG